MQDATETISNLPLAALVPVGLLLVVGLILWAAGSRVLRAAFAATGLVVGGSAGWLIGEWLDQRAIELGGPWVFAIAAGLVVALLAALVYRLAIAAALAIVCAVAAPTIALAIAEHERAAPIEFAADTEEDSNGTEAPPRIDSANDWLLTLESAEPASEVDTFDAGAAVLGLDEHTTDAIQEVRTTAEALRDRILARWEATPRAFRPILIGAALAGILVGLLLGSLAPSLSAAVVSSFGGSLLWMASARMLIGESEFAQTATEWIPDSPPWRLGIWLGVALIGLAIQWTFRPRPADRAG